LVFRALIKQSPDVLWPNKEVNKQPALLAKSNI